MFAAEQVRSIIQSLELGAGVVFLDMDVEIRGQAASADFLKQYDLM
jgi:hypothetical protein